MVFIPEGIARVLDRALKQRPDALALVGRSARLSYRELDHQAAKAAGALKALGVQPGDRVAASLPNDVDVVVAFHGAMRVGAIWVGVNAALTESERAALLADCAPTAVLDDHDAWRKLVHDAVPIPSTKVDVHAPAGIAYTSGTTGAPKGIVHSQHNLLVPGAVLVAERGYGPWLIKGDCLPLTILNMQVLTSLLTAQAQGCCIVMDRRDAAGIAEWIRNEGINVWNGVPAQLFDLVRSDEIRVEELECLREIWSGGGDCPDSLRQEFLEKFRLTLRCTYGLTEAPTIVSMDPTNYDPRPGASGRVMGHLKVVATDDDGNELPAGEVGEISVSARADGNFPGLWRPMLGVWDGSGVEKFEGEVLRTGDLGEINDGWLSIRDRKKLLIVSGGANIYPAEVERVLVADARVAGAAIFGLADERMGEIAVGAVECVAGQSISAKELSAICSESLAKYKVPRSWVLVEELPRNAMGKVIRAALPELVNAAGLKKGNG